MRIKRQTEVTGLHTEMFHWGFTDNGYSSSSVRFWPTCQLMDNRELFMEQPTPGTSVWLPWLCSGCLFDRVHFRDVTLQSWQQVLRHLTQVEVALTVHTHILRGRWRANEWLRVSKGTMTGRFETLPTLNKFFHLKTKNVLKLKSYVLPSFSEILHWRPRILKDVTVVKVKSCHSIACYSQTVQSRASSLHTKACTRAL